jgi:hypothetical protein
MHVAMSVIAHTHAFAFGCGACLLRHVAVKVLLEVVTVVEEWLSVRTRVPDGSTTNLSEVLVEWLGDRFRGVLVIFLRAIASRAVALPKSPPEPQPHTHMQVYD